MLCGRKAALSHLFRALSHFRLHRQGLAPSLGSRGAKTERRCERETGANERFAEPTLSAPLETAFASVGALRPNERNARTHPKKQIRQVANSIDRFGWTYPIIVDENNVILAGHARYEAALLLNRREVPVIVMGGLSDAEKRAFALADNKIAANAGWNRQLLAEELGDLAKLLPEINLDVAITGFEPAEIDGLLGDLADPEVDPADEIPPPQNRVISTVGDLWELDPHKLMCGDALSPAAIRRLMGGELAAMVITDPPYNVPITRIQALLLHHFHFRRAALS